MLLDNNVISSAVKTCESFEQANSEAITKACKHGR